MRTPSSTSSSRRAQVWLLARRGALLAALLATCFGLLACALPKVPDSFLCGYRLKHDRLAALPPGKLVICGGSNVAFGMDTAQLERATGREGVNLGLVAGLGLSFMLADVRPHIAAGDLVILAPEYDHFSTGLWGGTTPLGSLLLDVPEAWCSVPAASYRILPAAYLRAVQIRLATVCNTGFKVDLREVEPIYQTSSFNAQGDVVAHLGFAPSQIALPDSLAALPQRPCAKTVGLIRDFADWCEARGATLVIVPPAIVESAYRKHQVFIDQVWADLEAQLGSRVRGKPADYAFPRPCFFDTVYHLNGDGVRKRMATLLAALADLCPESAPMPPEVH